jgi:Tetracyclin repressor-like, C-terminal domain
MIADAERDLRLRDRLLGRATKAGDQRERPLGPVVGGLGRKLKDRPVETNIADGELRGVNADRQPSGARIDVIARQRALVPLVNAGTWEFMAQASRLEAMHSPLVSMVSTILREGVRKGVFRRRINPVQFYISIAADRAFLRALELEPFPPRDIVMNWCSFCARANFNLD